MLPAQPAGNHTARRYSHGRGLSERCQDKHDSVAGGATAPDPPASSSSVSAASSAHFLIGALAAVGYVLSVAQSAPTLDSLTPKLAGATSQVYAANGTRLGFIQSDVLRSPITSAQMPTDLRNATVAIEDQRFYQNNGVDLTGIFRSAVKDVLHGQALQGASTITMQLMRNIYSGQRHAQLQTEDRGGQARDRIQQTPLQALDPDRLPQQRRLRHRGRTDGPGSAGRLEDLLQRERLPAQPAAGRPARRPAPGALPIQPLPLPGRRPATSQRGARQDGRTALHHPRHRQPPPRPRAWK